MGDNSLRRISWEEYGKICEKIYKEVSNYIKKNDIKVDAIVPIMRGAMTLSSFLSYKLKVLRILPVQYKYFFVGKNKAELRQILFCVKEGNLDTKEPTFLIVEGDQCFGNTVITTIKDIKKEFPNCKIIHIADCVDYKYRDAVKDADVSFFGKYTNHCEELSEEECKKAGVEYNSTIAPWENVEEESLTIKGEQFVYEDIDSVMKDSKKKMEIDF